ncbi:hypothetical protein [Microbacterium suwonense]|uniref:Uncharacterized protein n=1 Tax=Microbacterium suwonense TaxID=683047 RepID=A0ABM8FX42_9MICO|nr:hypothetical protein [Microbacterium suwonense]BDZ40292.1 hypothetical protein GCM10025863_29060 [Microbacterium suwonense]
MTIDQPHRSGVVIVGSVTADVTAFSQRLPARGETILGEEFTMVLGGKGRTRPSRPGWQVHARASSAVWETTCSATSSSTGSLPRAST